MKSFPVLTLLEGRERSLNLRHPWLFSGAVKKVEPCQEGDIVEIHTADGKRVGYGFFSMRSQIRVKIFSFSREEIEINEDFWFAKFQSAWNLRQTLLDSTQTNGFRFIHAEGDFMPGIVADCYNSVCSVQLRTQGTLAMAQILCDFLTQKTHIKHVYLKAEDRQYSKWLVGECGEEVFMENGVKFLVNVESGQKTGFFLDQRNNRQLVGHHAKGRSVLNAFSYTGGFSAYAALGGAKDVTSLDISASATAMCQRNIELNLPDYHDHSILTTDCFKYLKDMEQGRFDMVILDPPAFSKSNATVQNAARGYKEINMKALIRIAPNGLLFTYSCSQHVSRELFQKIVFGAAADAHRNVRILAHLSQGEDHPIDICHPEGDYLKGLMLWVE